MQSIHDRLIVEYKLSERGSNFMRREGTFEDISDGRRYGLNDMVKAGCAGCEGCSDCCRGMDDTIVLDPYDIVRMTNGCGKSFEALLQEGLIALSVYDGIILPHIAMAGKGGACGFLNQEGRCRIHSHRPGICRLFPLGRIYENGSFSYFLQTNQCRFQNPSKVKIKNWLDTPETAKYEAYICKWHYFIKELTEYVARQEDGQRARTVNMLILQNFYVTSFERDADFFEQFEKRLNSTKIAILGEMI